MTIKKIGTIYSAIQGNTIVYDRNRLQAFKRCVELSIQYKNKRTVVAPAGYTFVFK